MQSRTRTRTTAQDGPKRSVWLQVREQERVQRPSHWWDQQELAARALSFVRTGKKKGWMTKRTISRGKRR